MPSSEKSSFRRLMTYFWPHRWKMALSLLCVTIVSAAPGTSAYMVKPIMDDVFIREDRRMLALICMAAVFLYALKGVFRFINATILRMVGQRVIARIRDELYRHYQYFSVDYYTDTATGIMMSRITNDVQLMQRAVPSIIDFFRQPLTLLGLVGVAVFMNWKMSLLGMVIFPITAIPIAKFGKRVRKWAKRGQERMGQLTSILKENFSGIRVIKAFGMEEYEIARFSKENESYMQAQIKQIVNDELTAPLIELLGAIGLAGILFYGGQMVFNKEITPGEFFSFIAAAGLMYEPIKKLGKVNMAFQQALAAADRIFEIFDTDTSVTDSPDAVELADISGEVRFEGVGFSYNETPVLKGINLAARSGEVIALVGSSGSGKTTMVDMIPRFYDVKQGRILVDGRDIREVTIKSLRQQIAVVTQDVFLFDDTVTNNIAYGHSDVDAAAVIEAARAANAHEFISQLPQGYDTQIGELGVRLSGGQRQRLSIARALFKDAPILILDEATSALDTEAEIEVQAALENLMRGRTTFVIAHRLSTIRNADRILVLADGRFVEEGCHEELMARQGAYYRLYQLQFHQ